jgi:hypothetical protein
VGFDLAAAVVTPRERWWEPPAVTTTATTAAITTAEIAATSSPVRGSLPAGGAGAVASLGCVTVARLAVAWARCDR